MHGRARGRGRRSWPWRPLAGEHGGGLVGGLVGGRVGGETLGTGGGGRLSSRSPEGGGVEAAEGSLGAADARAASSVPSDDEGGAAAATAAAEAAAALVAFAAALRARLLWEGTAALRVGAEAFLPLDLAIALLPCALVRRLASAPPAPLRASAGFSPGALTPHP